MSKAANDIAASNNAANDLLRVNDIEVIYDGAIRACGYVRG